MLILFRMGLFGTAHRWEIQKIQNICKSCDTFLEFCRGQHFFTVNQKFCYIKKCRYILYFNTYFPILFTFSKFLKVFLINTVATLIMSAKLATLSLLKIKTFGNKGYDVIIFAHDVTNRFSSSDSMTL